MVDHMHFEAVQNPRYRDLGFESLKWLRQAVLGCAKTVLDRGSANMSRSLIVQCCSETLIRIMIGQLGLTRVECQLALLRDIASMFLIARMKYRVSSKVAKPPDQEEC